MQPLITVIVPVYQVEELLKRCIDSIVGQTYKNLEIILVDDGSLDNSGRICDEYARKDSRIRVIHQENKGLSGARNAALERASGQYIGFVDSDDYIDADMYEYLWSLIEKEKTDIATCGYRKIIGGCTYARKAGEEVSVYSSEEAIALLTENKALKSMAWMHLYNGALFKDLRFPQGHVYEDIYTIYKVMKKAKKIAVSQVPKYNYLIRKNGISQIQSENNLWDRYCAYKQRFDDILEHYPNIAQNAVNQLALSCIDIYNSLCLLNGQGAPKKKEITNFFKANKGMILLRFRSSFGFVKAAEVLHLNKLLWRLFNAAANFMLKRDMGEC